MTVLVKLSWEILLANIQVKNLYIESKLHESRSRVIIIQICFKWKIWSNSTTYFLLDMQQWHWSVVNLLDFNDAFVYDLWCVCTLNSPNVWQSFLWFYKISSQQQSMGPRARYQPLVKWNALTTSLLWATCIQKLYYCVEGITLKRLHCRPVTNNYEMWTKSLATTVPNYES